MPRNARYDEHGQRVTTCCGVYSTYTAGWSNMGDVLCCKKCWHEVPVGEGDGSEFRDPDDATTPLWGDTEWEQIRQDILAGD